MFLQVTVLWEVAACSGSYFCECGWGEAIRFFLNDSQKKKTAWWKCWFMKFCNFLMKWDSANKSTLNLKSVLVRKKKKVKLNGGTYCVYACILHLLKTSLAKQMLDHKAVLMLTVWGLFYSTFHSFLCQFVSFGWNEIGQRQPMWMWPSIGLSWIWACGDDINVQSWELQRAVTHCSQSPSLWGWASCTLTWILVRSWPLCAKYRSLLWHHSSTEP